MTLERFHFDGARAVLTGAASGMGEQMAHQLAARGTHLVLIDRDEPRLKAVLDQIRAQHPGIQVDVEVADLSDVPGVETLVERILSISPQVDLLINNAGVALGGEFSEVTAEEFDWVQDVNFRAPVALTRGLLPSLLASPGSHIVNVSSLFGLIGPAGQSAYSSSKFAIRGFSEVLRHELTPRGVGVTTVHPGGIATRIAETARVAASASEEDAARGKAGFAKLLTYPADKAAAQILNGVEKRKGRVLIAYTAVVPDLLARLFPTNYSKVIDLLQPGASRNAQGRTRENAQR